MAFLDSPALASPVMSWARAVTVTKETAMAEIVVSSLFNSLFILRAQLDENSDGVSRLRCLKQAFDYIWPAYQLTPSQFKRRRLTI
jgi:hypothetical protein